MIELKQALSREQRQAQLIEALRTQNRFERITFGVPNSNDIYQTRIEYPRQSNRDFVLTELTGNLGEIYYENGLQYFLNISNGRERLKSFFSAGKQIVSEFIVNQRTHLTPAYANEQSEGLPVIIERNSQIQLELTPVQPEKTAIITPEIYLNGFEVLLEPLTMDAETTAAANRSLEKPRRVTNYSIELEGTSGNVSLQLQNAPLLLTGFQIEGYNENGDRANIEVRITDVYRRMSFSPDFIPLHAIASYPNQSFKQYRLPILHYLQPFSQIDVAFRFASEFVATRIYFLTVSI